MTHIYVYRYEHTYNIYSISSLNINRDNSSPSIRVNWRMKLL